MDILTEPFLICEVEKEGAKSFDHIPLVSQSKRQ